MFAPTGIIAAVITPFNKDESLNEAALREHVRSLLNSRVTGLFVVGTGGEFWALTKDEKKRVFEITVDEANGKKPVYAGTGVESTGEALELTKMAKDIGVDAVSIITPYFVSPTRQGLFEHYSTIAGKVDLPIVLYNNPGRAGGVNLEPSLVRELAENHSNIVGIKDSSGDLRITTEYIRLCDKINVLAGADGLIFASLLCGSKGAIAVTANVLPNLVADIYECVMKGEIQKALKAQRELVPLRQAVDRVGPYPLAIKEALNMMGRPVGPCRKPIIPATQERREELKRILLSYEALRSIVK
jgi:4-hydroxy-tetrahydrodipicolinate synthase